MAIAIVAAVRPGRVGDHVRRQAEAQLVDPAGDVADSVVGSRRAPLGPAVACIICGPRRRPRRLAGPDALGEGRAALELTVRLLHV